MSGKSSKVYVIQRPAVRDRRTGEWYAKFDLSPAEAYGRLVDVLPIGEAGYWDVDSVVARAEQVLARFDPERDYLLAAGDPVAIAAVSMVASRVADGRGVRILKWDKRDMSYLPYLIQVS